MAAAAAATTNLTTCPICKEMFDNPKSLPCLHAFCLKCIQNLYRKKSPGDRATCPLCREEFQIPRDGVEHLKHHFMVQQLLDKEKERQGSCCEKHNDKEVELYCHECKENICVKCYVEKHRNHNIVLIPEVADDFRPRMNEDDERILSVINAVREKSEQIKKTATEFVRNAEEIKKKVVAVGDVIKHSVDSQVNDVLVELQSVISESANEAESAQKAYQQAIAPLESFHTESRELLDKDRPSDITRAACELHDRARELLSSDFPAVKYHPPHVTFTPADVTQVKRINLIGKITVKTEEQPGNTYI